MSKNWLALIIVGGVILIGWTGYQFYLSFTESEIELFDYNVEPIQGELNSAVLDKVGEVEGEIQVKLGDIRE